MKLVENKKIFFDETTHTYLDEDNNVLIGVTSLMKEMGLSPSSYKDIPEDVLERAARRGSATHKAIERYCKGEKDIPELSDPEFGEETRLNLYAFTQLGLKVLANEYLVSDNEHIASSIDLVPDDLSLIDIKTTFEVHWESVAWQLSIYKYLFELQNPKKKVKRLQVLHIRGGKAKLYDVAEIPQSEVKRLITAYKNGETFIPDALIKLTPEEEKAISLLSQLEEKIVSLKAQAKAFEEQKAGLVEGIITLMEKHSVKKWEVSPTLSFTYVAPVEKETIDSKKLKEEQPEIFKEYSKKSTTKASLRINIKEK